MQRSPKYKIEYDGRYYKLYEAKRVFGLIAGWQYMALDDDLEEIEAKMRKAATAFHYNANGERIG